MPPRRRPVLPVPPVPLVTPTPPVPPPPVPPAPAPIPAAPPALPAPAPAPARRFSAALFWAIVGALIVLFVANLAGYGPAIVRHERVRVVLPPSSRQAVQPAQTARRIADPKPRVTALPTPQVGTPTSPPASVGAAPAAPTPSVAAPAPAQRVNVDININVNVRAPQPAVLVPPPTPVPTYHEEVVCDRYQGCTHFWVDPPAPLPPVSPPTRQDPVQAP